MIQLARLLTSLVALFGIVMGLGFLVRPQQAGAMFFLSPNGVPGLAVLRADMTAFFLAGGLLAAVSAWRCKPALLIAPIILYATAITGRAVSLVFDGVTPGAYFPMAVEALIVASLVFAYRTFSAKS